MKTIVLRVRDDSYHKVKKIINTLNKEMTIVEIIENQNYTFNKEKLVSLLKNKTTKVFQNIDDPVRWQKKQREEWD